MEVGDIVRVIDGRPNQLGRRYEILELRPDEKYGEVYVCKSLVTGGMYYFEESSIKLDKKATKAKHGRINASKTKKRVKKR